MIITLMVIPFISGIAAFFLSKRAGRTLLILVGALHLALSSAIWIKRPPLPFADFFALTPAGLLSLFSISVLFFMIAIYSIGYLSAEETLIEKGLFQGEPLLYENIFIGAMLIFLSTMTMVTLADHIMVMWIAIEATTLASAPLIYSHRTAKSLEATWKYVLICSVGIAMALLGSIFIGLAMDAGKVNSPLSFSAITLVAKDLDPVWLKTGFVFILVGYGTKMGLAPMHTWLPDAHSEAPSPASALLSGVLLNCAYLGIFKTDKIMNAAGLGSFSGTALIVFGLISILAAATFILKQTEYKRLLAYSSIENMGIIAFGTGIGGLGTYGAILCLLHHSLIKSSLFLTSGNILMGYGSALIEKTGNLVRSMPRSFTALFAGFAGIAGFPPFGIFIGEFFIIMAALRTGRFIAAAIFIVSLCIIFAGFSNQIMKISFGPTEKETIHLKERAALIWPQYVLLLTSITLCFWMPESLYRTIINAVGGM